MDTTLSQYFNILIFQYLPLSPACLYSQHGAQVEETQTQGEADISHSQVIYWSCTLNFFYVYLNLHLDSLYLEVFMCARVSDLNVGSKEQELKRLLEVLRIKAETQVRGVLHLFSQCH